MKCYWNQQESSGGPKPKRNRVAGWTAGREKDSIHNTQVPTPSEGYTRAQVRGGLLTTLDCILTPGPQEALLMLKVLQSLPPNCSVSSSSYQCEKSAQTQAAWWNGMPSPAHAHPLGTFSPWFVKTHLYLQPFQFCHLKVKVAA